MFYALFALDLTILLLGALRFTRLVTTDDIPGQWWLYAPLYKKAVTAEKRPVWFKYLSGLTCPFCIGFWIGALLLLSLLIVGGPGDAALWWRYLVGAFALNYVVGHASGRLD